MSLLSVHQGASLAVVSSLCAASSPVLGDALVTASRYKITAFAPTLLLAGAPALCSLMLCILGSVLAVWCMEMGLQEVVPQAEGLELQCQRWLWTMKCLALS